MSELERRIPLKRSGRLRRTPMKRTAAKGRRVLPNGEVEAARERKREQRNGVEFSPKTKRRASNRFNGDCAICLGPKPRPAVTFHHRLMKSQGGLGTFENCLPLCHEHHRLVHAETGWSYRHGYLIRAGGNPASVDVMFGCGSGCVEDHVDQ